MTTAKGRAPVPDGQDSAADRTIQAITEMIISGHLNPGDRLPTERDLAQRLNVSRNTLREAIRCLEVMGIVDVRHGDGTYVTSLEPCKLLDTTGFVTRLLRDHTGTGDVRGACHPRMRCDRPGRCPDDGR